MAPDDPHRLPRQVAPERYDLHIATNLDTGRFEGDVTVALIVAEPTARLVCNAADLTVTAVTVTQDGQAVPVTDVTVDADTQRLTVLLDRPLQPGPATLSVNYTSELSDRLVGFYRSTYTDDRGGTEVIAVTQFEAPHARRAFPCWDEPDRKATFAIRLTVAAGLEAISNAPETSRVTNPDGTVTFAFADTIAMSTYLVAWVIGRLEATEAVVVRGIPVRVVHRPGQAALAGTALDVAAHAVAWFEDYYGIAFPGGKMDLVAVPDFSFGAMENLGCITFREALLLVDPDEANQVELERVATVIEHEIAHMWFGDLVTMRWWTGIWLNEAFATHMELACADAYRPDWDVWTSFGLSRTQAFDVDSLAATRPIEYEVRTPADAEGMFDLLTYEKGAAVLRMVEQFVGPEVWRAGIRAYLAEHAGGNTDTADLWRALDAASEHPISEIMNSWILQGGHPIVTVAPTDTGVSVTQERFVFAGADPTEDHRYRVPLTLRAGVDGHDGPTEARVLLVDERADIDLGGRPAWVEANASGAGFFRVAYTDDLRRALVERRGELDPLGRFTIVDDAWAAVMADRFSTPELVGVLRAMADDTDPSVWRRLAAATSALVALACPLDAGALARDLVGDRWRDLTDGRRLPSAEAQLAGILLRAAGVAGRDPGAAERSRAITAAADVPGDIAAAALEVVAANGDDRDFDDLLGRARTAATPQDELRALGALTLFDDPALVTRLLTACLDDIRGQNVAAVVSRSLANPRTGAVAWEFVTAHWDELCKRVPSTSVVRMTSGLTSVFDPAVLDDAVAFLSTHPVEVAQRTLDQQVETLRVNLALRHRERDRLVAALGAPPTEPDRR